jgi:membrane protease YdiL (CAAX protease family)
LTPFQVPFSAAYLLMVLVNPLAEEFFVRGFLQTRLRSVGWSGPSSVVASTVLQGSYHLYQGLPSCLLLTVVFLIFAVYYQSKRRLWPVVIAHLMENVLAMLVYMKH